jgi:hypothetical protein
MENPDGRSWKPKSLKATGFAGGWLLDWLIDPHWHHLADGVKLPTGHVMNAAPRGISVPEFPVVIAKHPRISPGASQPETNAGSTKKRTPAAGNKSPYSFFGHPLTRRGAIPHSKRRRYLTSVKVAAGGRFV